MKKGKPVEPKFSRLQKAVEEVREQSKSKNQLFDFSNTRIAFADKSDEELKKAAWLFRLMNKPWLVEMGSKLGLAAIRMRLPLADTVVKKTIFEQFCGGTTLLESVPSIQRLFAQKTVTILDYGAEAKDSDEDLNKSMNETIRAIEFAATHDSVPVVSSKISALARNDLLQMIQDNEPHTAETRVEYKTVLKRMDAICNVASRRGVAVFFDAEESWIQDTIDHLVTVMMRRYNRGKVVVYNTFQMYRHDRMQFLIDSFNTAQTHGYMLGAKLVRGAYMEKERDRAEKMGYSSPIHPTKDATDDAFNTGIKFCLDNFDVIALCNATHNAESCKLMANIIHEKGLKKDHSHLNFCQLYGMSDHLTFNLAAAGYNTAKYLVYGQVKEVLPYLIRRAEENTSVAGDMSRELHLIMEEIKRRNLE